MPADIQKQEVPDTWELEAEDRRLIRHHNTPRDHLFVPTEAIGSPVPLDKLTGRRATIWTAPDGGSGSFIDDFRKSKEPGRKHIEGWKGTTILEIAAGTDVLGTKRKEPPTPSPALTRKLETKKTKEADKKEAKREKTPDTTITNTPGQASSSKDAMKVEQADNEADAQGVDGDIRAERDKTPDATITNTPGPEVFRLDAEDHIPEISPEVYAMIKRRIQVLESDTYQEVSIKELKKAIMEMRTREKSLLKSIESACDAGHEAMFVEFDVEDLAAFVASPPAYTKGKLASATAAKEVNYRQLDKKDKARMHEAMAREISEVLRSQAVKAASEGLTEEEVKERIIPMRWILKWKPTPDGKPPQSSQNEVAKESGLEKAKARIVLIGYKHPDLAQRDQRTGQPRLLTASPTLSRLGRCMLFQAAALDEHVVECADARSAFLQADNGIGTDALFTRGVPELAYALGLKPGTLMEVVGAVYGLTNAPRIFWMDVDSKMRALGAEPHPIDKCIWIFKDGEGKVIGRVGVHVDDFLICGSHKNGDWMKIREKIGTMYQWSPWKKGSFTFAGLEVQQLGNFEIRVTQQSYCNALRPVEIENEKSRSENESLTPRETSQYRGLVMKGQWRAVQTAFQYRARVGLAASAANQATVRHLREANAIMRELRKTAKDDMVFHAFNYGREEKLAWGDLVAVHFSDASLNNRPDGGSTGGYITTFSEPSVLEGKEARMSVLDWRSWKLDRPVKGSNGSESQGLFEGEDKGWKCRLFWGLINGEKMNRTNPDQLASMVESLLVTDSRGIYDAVSASDSPMLGINNSRTGIEALAVQQGLRRDGRCYLTWVPSDMNLADALTKRHERLKSRGGL